MNTQELRLAVPGPLQQTLTLAATLYWPERLPADTLTLYFCVPGGGLDRHYYHLVTDDGSTRFSLVQPLVDSGALVVCLDPPAVGGSDEPANGFALTPEHVADYNAAALDAILEQLGRGTLPGVSTPEKFQVIGVGHSIGGMFISIQQARRRQFNALAVLGFSNIGMTTALPEAARPLCGNPRAREYLSGLARDHYAEPFPELPSNGQAREVFGGHAAREALDALRRCRSRLLATASMGSLLPGCYQAEFDMITVPVYLAMGDQDICGGEQTVLDTFPNAPCDPVQVLTNTGHSHFIFESVRDLASGIIAWATKLRAQSVPA